MIFQFLVHEFMNLRALEMRRQRICSEEKDEINSNTQTWSFTFHMIVFELSFPNTG